jgi:predicted restriction endonuclease
LVVTNTELETLLNIEYLFLEANKEKDFTKFLPTILFNIVKEDLLSESFLKEWSKQQIKDIENCFLYNSNRDAEFKKAVQPYLDSL